MQYTYLQLLASGLLLFAVPNVAATDFSASCSDWYMDGTVLYASCNAADGVATNTAVDLTDCLTNTNGSLACAAVGDYSDSCTDCAIESGTSYLLCDCQNGSGGDPASILDLNSCLSNNNGSLACGFDSYYY
ncbi:Cyanovirin-N [Hygrophoropsis aurantiaca]|uniref:Cyanovirin-N n=1 Tax=Hygrophoropsis aurantiaca TaxID=72124 RepID=A0ACB8AB14_9AGAM|nr:Cyanovirin-N [Hygrophoropsis aurantiaca]